MIIYQMLKAMEG